MSEILEPRRIFPKIMVISKKKGFHLNLVSYFSIFVPKARCSLKKRSSPEFGNYFLQLIIVTALKFLTLSKFFISLPEKFWFCPNIFLHCPKNFNFAQILETWRAIAPFPPGRYGYAFPYLQPLLYFVLNYNQLFFWMQIKTNCYYYYYYYFNNLQYLGLCWLLQQDGLEHPSKDHKRNRLWLINCYISFRQRAISTLYTFLFIRTDVILVLMRFICNKLRAFIYK